MFAQRMSKGDVVNGEVKIMPGRILNVTFKFNVTGDQYIEAVTPLVEDVTTVPGLRWKIWIINETESEAGGIHLFDDETACNNYLAGSTVATITSHPALSDFEVKQFDIMEEQTESTRGPVGALVHN